MKKISIISTTVLAAVLIISLNETIAQGWDWSVPFPTGNWIRSVWPVDSNTVYAVGTHGTILKTPNGGINWENQVSGTSVILNSVFFIDENKGFAAGKSGTILSTNN